MEGGGVACYIKKTLSYNDRPGFCSNIESIIMQLLSIIESIWFELLACLNQDQFW